MKSKYKNTIGEIQEKQFDSFVEKCKKINDTTTLNKMFNNLSDNNLNFYKIHENDRNSFSINIALIAIIANNAWLLNNCLEKNKEVLEDLVYTETTKKYFVFPDSPLYPLIKELNLSDNELFNVVQNMKNKEEFDDHLMEMEQHFNINNFLPEIYYETAKDIILNIANNDNIQEVLYKHNLLEKIVHDFIKQDEKNEIPFEEEMIYLANKTIEFYNSNNYKLDNKKIFNYVIESATTGRNTLSEYRYKQIKKMYNNIIPEKNANDFYYDKDVINILFKNTSEPYLQDFFDFHKIETYEKSDSKRKKPLVGIYQKFSFLDKETLNCFMENNGSLSLFKKLEELIGNEYFIQKPDLVEYYFNAFKKEKDKFKEYKNFYQDLINKYNFKVSVNEMLPETIEDFKDIVYTNKDTLDGIDLKGLIREKIKEGDIDYIKEILNLDYINKPDYINEVLNRFIKNNKKKDEPNVISFIEFILNNKNKLNVAFVDIKVSTKVNNETTSMVHMLLINEALKITQNNENSIKRRL